MPQTTQLISTLKRSLKQHGKTYRDVAAHLALSEASVKRLFSEKNFTLHRLDEICALLDMELSDLVQQMRANDNSVVSALSIEQEREIADDLLLLLITVCVLQRWSVQEILDHYQIRCISSDLI